MYIDVSELLQGNRCPLLVFHSTLNVAFCSFPINALIFLLHVAQSLLLVYVMEGLFSCLASASYRPTLPFDLSLYLLGV